MFPHLPKTQHFEHFTSRNHQPGCETKELRTDCRQTAWKCPPQVNRNRYALCHALQDEKRLRTKARAIGKQSSPSTVDLQHFSTNTHGFRWVRATMVFWFPQIWTPCAVTTTCSHTPFHLLYLHTDGNIRRAPSRSLKRSTRHKTEMRRTPK